MCLLKGVEIEDNGVRETDAKYRKMIDETIQLLLNKYIHKIKNLNTLSGTTEERIAQMKEVIFS